MSFENLKQSWRNLVEDFIGVPCPSGLGHRMKKSGHLRDDKYCCHNDCDLAYYKSTLQEIELNSARVVVDDVYYEGPFETICKLNQTLDELDGVNETVDALKEYNNKAFKDGCTQGMKMERANLYNTVATSRQILIDAMSMIGITEFKVPQFVDWFEKQRDAAVCPRQDVVTYKTCKNIMELSAIMAEVQTEGVQLT